MPKKPKQHRPYLTPEQYDKAIRVAKTQSGKPKMQLGVDTMIKAYREGEK